MALVEQQLGLATLDDGTAIQLAVAGRGPVAVYVPGWVSHLELGWALPSERQFYEGLADHRTLVRYDRPGCGLSGRTCSAWWTSTGVSRRTCSRRSSPPTRTPGSARCSPATSGIRPRRPGHT